MSDMERTIKQLEEHVDLRIANVRRGEPLKLLLPTNVYVLKALLSRIAELEEGLRPFAESQCADTKVPGNAFHKIYACDGVTLADFRRARSLLQKPEVKI